ncbi:hypothetical protein [Virgibacillus sp. Bac330]|uniref:hypothetical protein n=1 Tax=Virgibacillus sp. Bac330 TaxID=2419841 RepID=UPI000EF48398|nr:hypothetical protein [Virgibacillus sp. Bac330]
MQQVHLYEYLGAYTDPLYQKIERLQVGESLQCGEVCITYTKFNLYELTSEEIHECYSTLDKCYERVCEV